MKKFIVTSLLILFGLAIGATGGMSIFLQSAQAAGFSAVQVQQDDLTQNSAPNTQPSGSATEEGQNAEQGTEEQSGTAQSQQNAQTSSTSDDDQKVQTAAGTAWIRYFCTDLNSIDKISLYWDNGNLNGTLQANMASSFKTKPTDGADHTITIGKYSGSSYGINSGYLYGSSGFNGAIGSATASGYRSGDISSLQSSSHPANVDDTGIFLAQNENGATEMILYGKTILSTFDSTNGWSFTAHPGSDTYFDIVSQRINLVTYDINGASGSVNTYNTVRSSGGQRYYEVLHDYWDEVDCSYSIASASGLSRSGYTFLGWNTQKDGSGKRYQPGQDYVPSGDLTLYAEWALTSNVSTLNMTVSAPASSSSLGTVSATMSTEDFAAEVLPSGGSSKTFTVKVDSSKSTTKQATLTLNQTFNGSYKNLVMICDDYENSTVSGSSLGNGVFGGARVWTVYDWTPQRGATSNVSIRIYEAEALTINLNSGQVASGPSTVGGIARYKTHSSAAGSEYYAYSYLAKQQITTLPWTFKRDRYNFGGVGVQVAPGAYVKFVNEDYSMQPTNYPSTNLTVIWEEKKDYVGIALQTGAQAGLYVFYEKGTGYLYSVNGSSITNATPGTQYTSLSSLLSASGYTALKNICRNTYYSGHYVTVDGTKYCLIKRNYDGSVSLADLDALIEAGVLEIFDGQDESKVAQGLYEMGPFEITLDVSQGFQGTNGTLHGIYGSYMGSFGNYTHRTETLWYLYGHVYKTASRTDEITSFSQLDYLPWIHTGRFLGYYLANGNRAGEQLVASSGVFLDYFQNTYDPVIESTTLYPVWEGASSVAGRNLEITLDPNGGTFSGSGGSANKTLYFDKQSGLWDSSTSDFVSVLPWTVSRSRYVFNGFRYGATTYISSDGTIDVDSLRANIGTSDWTLTAEWNEILYFIDLDLQGGEGWDLRGFLIYSYSREMWFYNLTPDPNFSGDGGGYSGLNDYGLGCTAITKSGYYFDGFYTTRNSGGYKIVNHNLSFVSGVGSYIAGITVDHTDVTFETEIRKIYARWEQFGSSDVGGSGSGKRVQISATLSDSEFVYNTKEHSPTLSSISVTVDGEDAGVAVEDVTLSYYNNINASSSAECRITLPFMSSGSYYTIYFTISRRSISDATITVSTSYTYTGSSITPTSRDITVRLSIDGTSHVLVYGDDYNNISVSNNVNAGAASLTVSGIGNYSGTASSDFQINPRSITSISLVDPVKWETTLSTWYTSRWLTDSSTSRKYVYWNGQPYYVEVTPTVDGSGVPVPTFGKGYTMSVHKGTSSLDPVVWNGWDGSFITTYAPRDVGVYFIQVQGTGNYTGVANVMYEIKAPSFGSLGSGGGGGEGNNFSVGTTTFTYNAQMQAPTISIEFAWRELVQGSDYVLEYYTDYSYSSHQGTRSDSIDAGNYTMKIVANNGNYQGYYEVDYVINPASLTGASVSLYSSSTTFNGQTHYPVVSSVETTEGLNPIEDTDFDVSYYSTFFTSSGTGTTVPYCYNAGTYYVKVEGNGKNYVDFAYTTYRIYKASIWQGGIDSGDIEFSFTATGNGSVKYSKERKFYFSSSEDEVYVYENNRYAPSSANLVGPVLSVYYINDDFDISVNLKFGGLQLYEGDDFEVEYTREGYNTAYDMASVGVIKLSVSISSSSDNYTDDGDPLVGAFIICPRPNGNLPSGGPDGGGNEIPDPDEDDYGTYDFNVTNIPSTEWLPASIRGSQASSLDCTVSWNGQTLYKGVDYTIYADVSNAGNSNSFTIYLQGSYSGTIYETFVVRKRSLAEKGEIRGVSAVYEYTGSDLKTAITNALTLRDKDLGTSTTIGKSEYSVSFQKDSVSTSTVLQTGRYTVIATATSSSNYGNSVSMTFEIEGKDITDVQGIETEYVFTGSAIMPKPTAVFAADQQLGEGNYTLTYGYYSGGWNDDSTSSHYINKGQYRVVVTGTGNFSGSITKIYNIVAKNVGDKISEQDVTVAETNFVYNRSVQTPEVTVSGLVVDVDYTISYQVQSSSSWSSASNPTDAGTYRVVINGTGNYTGTLEVSSKTFTIAKAQINSVELKETTAVYNAKAQSIEVSKVGTANGLSLNYSTEYTISYSRSDGKGDSNFTDAGVITVTVSGATSNFTSSATAQFTISKATLNVESLTLNLGSETTYDGKEHKPTVSSLTATNGTAITSSDYTVSYSRNDGKENNFTDAGTITVTVTINNSSNNFESGNGATATAQFVIKQKNLTDLSTTYTISTTKGQAGETDLTDDGLVFVGEWVVPKILFSNYGAGNTTYTLVEDTDYKVEYFIKQGSDDEKSTDNVEHVGEYRVLVTPISGNYTGTLEKNYKVTALTFSDENIEIRTYQNGQKLEGDQLITFTYDGTAKTLVLENAQENNRNVILWDTVNERELVFETDFELVDGEEVQIPTAGSGTTSATPVGGYIGNVSAGAANLVLRGLEDYTKNIIVVRFMINPVQISEENTGEEGTEGAAGKTLVLGLENGPFVYKATQYTPGLATAKLNGKDVLKSESGASNFVVTYQNNTDAGQATATIEGQNNFSGSFEIKFTITPREIDDTNVVDLTAESLKSFEFNGQAQNFKPSFKLFNFNLVEGEDNDFTLEYFRIKEGQPTHIDNCIEKGDYKVVVTGHKNFTGTREIEFDITAYLISGNHVTVDGAQQDLGQNSWKLADITFDWEEHKVDPKIIHKGGAQGGEDKTLQKDTDYSLSYNVVFTDGGKTEYVDVATITITVEGINDYSGTLTLVYNIVKANIATAERFTLQSEDLPEDNMKFYFKDADFEFNFTLTDSKKTENSGTLDNPTEYTIQYSENRKNVGKVTITFEGAGNFGGTIERHFEIVPVKFNENGEVDDSGEEDVGGKEDVPTLQIQPLSNHTYDGQEHKENVVVSFNGGILEVSETATPNVDLVISYECSFAAEGLSVRFVDSATITITVTGKGNFEGTSFTLQYSILQVDISSGSILIEADDEIERTFSGNAQTLTITKSYVGHTELTVTTTETYTNNIDAGQASVELNGTGNYTGTKTFQFTISPKSIEDEDVVFSWTKVVEWTGSPITQDDAVSFVFNGKTYKNSADGGKYNFTLEYDNNTDLSLESNATITVSGQGNFVGTKVLEFEIVVKILDSGRIKVTIEDADNKYDYNGNPIEPKIKVEVQTDSGDWETVAPENYTVTYKDEQNGNDHTNVGKKKLQIQFNKGFDYSGSSSGDDEFEIVAANLESAIDWTAPENVTFDYAAHQLKPNVSWKESVGGNVDVLKEGIAYTIAYFQEADCLTENTDFVNAHQVYIKLTAIGPNFSGEVTGIMYQILAKNLAIEGDETISFEYTASQPYTGQEVTPSVKVFYTVSGVKHTLESGDYSLAYENNENVTDNAIIKVTGLKNFEGTKQLTFAIGSVTIESFWKVDEIDSVYYMKKDQTPNVVVRLVSGGTVVDAGQYEVFYSNNRNVGQATVVISATSDNITGSLTVHFQILPWDLNQAKVQLKNGESFADWIDRQAYTYNALPIKPGTKAQDGDELKITIEGFVDDEGNLIELVVGEDVNLIYSADCTNVGNNNGLKELKIVPVWHSLGDESEGGYQNFVNEKALTYQIVALDLSDKDGNEAAGLVVSIEDWDEQLDYNKGQQVLQTRFYITINGVVLPSENYLVSYADNTQAGTATVTISPNSANLAGQLIKTFQIMPIDVIFEWKSAEAYEETDFEYFLTTLNPITYIGGEFTIEDQYATITLGEHTYYFTFTPTDNRNYKKAENVSVVINGKQLVVIGISAKPQEILQEDGSKRNPLIDGQTFEDRMLKVYLIYNDPNKTNVVLNPGQYTLSGLLEGNVMSYENGITISYLYEKNGQTFTDTVFVRPTVLGGEDGVEARNKWGFDEGVLMRVEKISDLAQIKEEIGEEAFAKLSNIRYLYKIVFYKMEEGQEQVVVPEEYTIWIDFNRLEGGLKPYQVLGEEVTDLQEKADANGFVEFDILAKLVLVSTGHGFCIIFWIILIATIIFLLILTTLVLVYLREQRKRKNQRKLEAHTNA